MKRLSITIAALAVLAFTLAACNNDGGGTADADARLDAAVEQFDVLETELAALQATQADTSDAILEELANVQANLATLTMAAAEIRGEMNRPITPADVRLGDWSGLLVYTRSGENVWIRPGACETEAPRVRLPAGETIIGTWHQAPTGPHCLSASEASPAGVTVDIGPGTIASVILPPEFEVVE